MYTMNQLTIIGLFRKYSLPGRHGRVVNDVTQLRESLQMVTNVSLSAALALDFFSSFSVWCFCAKDLIDQCEQRVSNCHDRAFFACAGNQSLIASTEV